MITFQEIKKLVEAGKVEELYLSTVSKWWTHSKDDLLHANLKGHECKINNLRRIIDVPSLPREERERYKKLLEMAADDQTLLDPIGSPIYIIKNTVGWVAITEQQPTKFGFWGLEALMIAHHQNCERSVYIDWEKYNDRLQDMANRGEFISLLKPEMSYGAIAKL